MEEKLSLKEAVKVVRRWLWLIISLAFGAAIIAVIVSLFLLKPIYENSTQFLVSQKHLKSSQEFTETDIRTNVQLIDTYKAIILSPRILEPVAQKLELTTPPEKLAEKIDISSAESSQVVTISVRDKDVKNATEIANTVVSVFQKEIPQLINVDNVQILSEAKLPSKPIPVSPNILLNIVIAMILGLLVGTGIAFLMEYLNSTVNEESDIVNKLQTPLLGVISHIGHDELDVSKVTKLFLTERRSEA